MDTAKSGGATSPPFTVSSRYRGLESPIAAAKLVVSRQWIRCFRSGTSKPTIFGLIFTVPSPASTRRVNQ